MAVAVLPLRPPADAVRQSGLEAVEFSAIDIRPHVEDHAGHLLPDPLTHEVRLARIHLEPLFEGGAADVDVKAADGPRQLLSPGEDQIIGIARVGGLCRAGQPGDPAIEAVAHRLASAGEVGAPWGRWGKDNRRGDAAGGL